MLCDHKHEDSEVPSIPAQYRSVPESDRQDEPPSFVFLEVLKSNRLADLQGGHYSNPEWKAPVTQKPSDRLLKRDMDECCRSSLNESCTLNIIGVALHSKFKELVKPIGYIHHKHSRSSCSSTREILNRPVQLPQAFVCLFDLEPKVEYVQLKVVHLMNDDT